MISPIPAKRKAKEDEIRSHLDRKNLEDKPAHPFAKIVKYMFKITGLHALGERNTLKIDYKLQDIVDNRLPESFNNYRILFVTDFHLNGHPVLIKHIRKHLLNNKSDIILFGGDYQVNSFGNYKKIRALYQELLKGIDTSNIYAVLGNHDEYKVGEILSDLGMNVLINEDIVFTRGKDKLLLTGIDDADRYESHKFHKITDDENQFNILLTHTPRVFAEAEKLKYHLLIAGHTHAGQICLPGRIPIVHFDKFPHKMAYGKWKFKSMTGYTSAGIGNTWVNVRFFCSPEVVEFTLKKH